MLLLHFFELKFGVHTPAKTSYLKRKTEEQLDVVIQPNNFLVSMHTLERQGFVVYQPNLDKLISSDAKENENMWQLTPKGRQYAETLHFLRHCDPNVGMSKNERVTLQVLPLFAAFFV
ncbi:hypothetical protein [Vibrio parahaemolyticus]|nr:hypothetical protein [Vibrio parahaemolyticus]MDF4340826.1 hypothetical protein [Vibrio parahaemolyticus]